MEAADLFLQYLDVMLRKEKELISEVWEAAGVTVINHADGSVKISYPDKQYFISQYYPETKEVSNGK